MCGIMFKISNYLFVLVMCGLVLGLSSSYAQDDEDLEALFGDLEADQTTESVAKASPSSRWYPANTLPVQKTLNANQLDFTTPPASGSPDTYVINVATTPLLNADPSSVMQKNVKIVPQEGNQLTFSIGSLQPNTTYYLKVTPVKGGESGTPTKELSFKTPAAQVWWTAKHGAADLNLANVSYTYEGNNYTVSWTPVDGAEKIQIYLKTADAWDYIKQPDVSMNAGVYKFTANKKGDYLVKMIPVDAANNPVWSELVQTIKVNNVPVAPIPTEEVVQTVPKVWPGLNLMIWLFLFGILVYMLYRSRAVNK